MSVVWIVITEDRHDDVDATPFTSEAEAIAFAELEVAANARHPELTEAEDSELTEAMREDGWVYYCRYSPEGDKVRVIRREVNLYAREVPSR